MKRGILKMVKNREDRKMMCSRECQLKSVPLDLI